MFKELFKDANKTLEELEAKIVSKQRDLRFINEQIDIKRSDLKALENKLNETGAKVTEAFYAPIRDCRASVDWDVMKAFSIERIISKTHQVPVTTIGYMLNGSVREWILFVNKEIHDALVEEFNTYVSKKTKL